MIELVRRLGGARVVVVGDLIADEYVYGRVARVSREAPVLILEYDSTEIVPGGAGNAANNVAALGGQVTLVSLIGRDEPGRRAERALLRRVDRGSLVRPAGFLTPVKTRILAGGIHSAKQQVVRIDRAASVPVDDKACAAFESRVLRAIRQADALLVSDYGSGLIRPQLVAQARKIFRGQRSSRLKAEATRYGMKPEGVIMVDSRYNLLKFHGMTACTPNESEVEQALGIRIGDNARALERAGRELLKTTRSAAVLITRGSRGMALFESGRATVHIPIVGSDQIADVTGAGDTVIASMTLALGAGASFEDAARLANHAGGIAVMKRGTATVGASELRFAISRGAIGRAADPVA